MSDSAVKVRIPTIGSFNWKVCSSRKHYSSLPVSVQSDAPTHRVIHLSHLFRGLFQSFVVTQLAELVTFRQLRGIAKLEQAPQESRKAQNATRGIELIAHGRVYAFLLMHAVESTETGVVAVQRRPVAVSHSKRLHSSLLCQTIICQIFLFCGIFGQISPLSGTARARCFVIM